MLRLRPVGNAGNMAARSLLGVLVLSMFVLIVFSITCAAARFRTLQISPHEACPLPSPIGHPYDCYANKCWCTNNTANCSRNYGSLVFVPRLPRGMEVLDLRYNKLTTIPGDFFVNVTNITSLVLSHNPLLHVSCGAFSALQRLKHLIMRDMQINETIIAPVFEGHTLECVDLHFSYLIALPDVLYNASTLEILIVFYNILGDLNLTRFEAMPRLRLLNWGSNHLQNVVPCLLRSLEILYLGLNDLCNFPDTCAVSGASFFPHLITLDLRKNLIAKIPSQLCLPELQNLQLSNNLIHYIEPDMFNMTRFPNLVYLYLETMSRKIVYISNYAFNNSGLKKISLLFNVIDFTKEGIVQPNTFAGCSSLNMLEIGGNMFEGISDEIFHRFFGHLAALKEISMFRTYLQTITERTFTIFPRLKTLRLYLNSLKEIPDGAFAGNPLLESLDLADNQITTIKPTTFTEENRKRLKTLFLGRNPFVCDCELRWFSEWLARNGSLFPDTYGAYNCSNRAAKVASFSMPDQACLLSRGQSELIVVGVSVVLLAATLFSSVFRFRWHIRLLLYEAFRGNEAARRRRLEEGHFDYDVFVSYASEDSHWVLDRLMPELEDRMGLRLCVHERDFIPGKNIVDNIADCVEQSKKILMVFSTDFVRSQWCQFELTFCLRHVIEIDDTLIIVCVDDVASRNLTTAMMAVMKTTVYLQWLEDDADALASFWGRLKIALREVAPLDQH